MKYNKEKRNITILKKKFYNYLNKINEKQFLTEQEIKRINNLFNSSKYKIYYKEVYKNNFNFIGFDLASDLKEKGTQYFIKSFIKKNGKPTEQNRNNFISKEMHNMILKKDFDFKFGGFTKITNGIFYKYFICYVMFDYSLFNNEHLYIHFGYDCEIIHNDYLKNTTYLVVERI